MNKKQVDSLVDEHKNDKSKRILQNHIANSITSMIHSEEDLNNAVKASRVLFGKSSKNDLDSLDEITFKEIFEGVPSSSIKRSLILKGMNVELLLSRETNFLKSLSEAKRALTENSISLNKNKISTETIISEKDLINDKYILLQRGRKNYHLVIIM